MYKKQYTLFVDFDTLDNEAQRQNFPYQRYHLCNTCSMLAYLLYTPSVYTSSKLVV